MIKILIPALIVAICFAALFIPDLRFTRRFPFVTTQAGSYTTSGGKIFKVAILIVAVVVIATLVASLIS